MIALKIIFAIFLTALHIIMMSIMIIFERDKPKNLIIWSVIFLFTSLLGYIIYLVNKIIYFKKKTSLITKEKEDQIYKNLINFDLKKFEINPNNEFFTFNNLAYNTCVTKNNTFEMFTNYDKFLENITKELKTATNYVYFEITSINLKSIDAIKPILLSLVENDVKVKLSYDRRLPFGLRKELKDYGISVNRFSNYKVFGSIYSNLRNIISIDGRVAFLSDLNIKSKYLLPENQLAFAGYKIKGDIAKIVDVNVRQDIVFASNKFIPYLDNVKPYNYNHLTMQYITNQSSMDIELAILKAIYMAKSSIQLVLKEFIPTDSIMSLLKFAINSNIDVRIIVPIKKSGRSKYYASRAYSKELALCGANVYLYDGYIAINQIVIDNSYALCGNFVLDREHINLSLQNLLIIEDEKIINQFNKLFDSFIDNSYRINDAKYMLLKEKFFKNFV